MDTKPDCFTHEMLAFLDGLRESGTVNMFGAATHLQETFADQLNRNQARKVLVYWMNTFGE